MSMACHELSSVTFSFMWMIHVFFVNTKIFIKLKNRLIDFCNICDWFVDNKLSIHFGDDKTKPILFASKFKRKNIKNFT